MLPRAKYLLVCLLLLAGCTTGQYGYQTGAPTSRLPTPIAGGGGTPGAAGAMVAILLPMTGARADLGQVLSQAAQLALPPGYAPGLDVIDTGSTAPGAAAAAQTAVAHGDQMILGPLTSAETGAVAPVAKAAGIPVLAFTNDAAQSQQGVWPIGILLGLLLLVVALVAVRAWLAMNERAPVPAGSAPPRQPESNRKAP